MPLLLHFTSCSGRWVWGLVGTAWLRRGAFRGGVGTGIAAAAHVGVAAVSAPAARGLIEVEARCLGVARFSVKVSGA